MRGAALVLLALTTVGLAQSPGASRPPARMRPGFESIRLQDATKIALTMGGPDFLGRDPKTPGYAAAAGYVMAHLQSAGVRPAGDGGSYFQRFTVQTTLMKPETATFGGGGIALKWAEDFTFGAEKDLFVRFRVAFLRVPKGKRALDADLERANGRVLIIASEDPTNDPTNAIASQTAVLPAPGRLAIVRPSNVTIVPGVRPQTTVKEAPAEGLGFSGLRLTLRAAQRLAAALGAKQFAEATATETTLELPDGEVEAGAQVTVQSEFSTMNVLGVVEGTDPKLKDEVVAIGAHLDHLGVSTGGTYYGADDNGSGSTAAILVARALALNPIKPKRTTLIAFWACEESGLFGSRLYVARPAFPLERTIAYLNMDMVGRNAQYKPWGDLAEDNEDAVYNGSVRLNSPDLYAAMAQVNRHVGLNIRDDKEDRTFRSDTGNFVRIGIPTAKVSTGEHPDYHRITDTPDKLNFAKIVSISRWIYLSAFALGDTPKPPKFVAGARYLTGTVTAPEGMTFTKDAVFEVQLLDISKGDRDPVLLDHTHQVRPGQAPFAFALVYRPEWLATNRQIVVRASVREGKRLVALTTSPVAVLTRGAPLNRVTVPVVSTKGE